MEMQNLVLEIFSIPAVISKVNLLTYLINYAAIQFIYVKKNLENYKDTIFKPPIQSIHAIH